MNFLDRIRRLGASRPAQIAMPERGKPSATLMKGGNNVLLHNHRPALREPRDEVRGNWITATARSTDAIHNSGYLAGGIDQAVALTVGTGLRLSSKPDHQSLGWTKERAREWSKEVERQFSLWSENKIECDAEGKRTLAQMAIRAYKQWFAYGEIVSLFPQFSRANTNFDQRVMMVPPTRLPQDSIPTIGLYQGVLHDAVGMPVGYKLKFNDLQGNYVDQTFQRFGPTGREQVAHIYDGDFGTVRGITPLISVLLRARQYDQLNDATLTTTLLQTIFAASIKSNDLPEEAFDSLATDGDEAEALKGRIDALADWYESGGIDLGVHGRVTHLFPGDELNFHNTDSPGDNYEAFCESLLREIAKAIGCTYEQLTGDYKGATYSSVRSATSEVWTVALQRRKHIVAPLMQAAYECFIEASIRSGRIAFPGGLRKFYRHKSAACKAIWMGP
ncbi:MAG: phage portal protein, partial [Hyphomicrobiales bacterium]